MPEIPGPVLRSQNLTGDGENVTGNTPARASFVAPRDGISRAGNPDGGRFLNERNNTMRKILLAGAAIAALGIGPAIAQEDAEEKRTFGAAAGATTGAIAGAVVGGPVGAIVGGFAGLVLGAETAVPEPAVQYVVANPVQPVPFEGELVAGAPVPETINVYEIPDYPDYGYVYLNNRPVVVDMNNRQVVYSPGVIVPDQTVTYVEQNPIDPVTIDAEITTGSIVPPDVELIEVPDQPSYGYIYTESGPVLVERGSRTVVWVE